jgi:Flp pilus assembly protein TadD
MNLGTVFYLSGKYEQAAGMYERAATLTPQDYLPVGNLAAAYAQIPEKKGLAGETFARAADLAEAAAKEADTDPTVFADLAIYYAHLGRRADARRRLSTSLALGAQYPEIQAAAAETLEALGDRAAAIEHLRKAIEGNYRRETLRRNPALSDLLEDPQVTAMLAASPQDH